MPLGLAQQLTNKKLNTIRYDHNSDRQNFSKVDFLQRYDNHIDLNLYSLGCVCFMYVLHVEFVALVDESSFMNKVELGLMH